MCDIVVLAEDAAKVAAGEKHTAAAVVALEAWFWENSLARKVSMSKVSFTFSKMWRNDIYFDGFCAYQTDTSGLVTVHSTKPRAKVAVAQVSISMCPLLCSVHGGEKMISGYVLVE